MHGSTVILVAFLTSAITTAGTVYVVERYGILPARAQAIPDSTVPDLHGMSESDARSNANAAHVSLFIASREPSSDAKPGTVLRQSFAPGQHVPRDHSVSVVVAEEVPKVPNVTNLTVVDATARLEQRGYTLQVGGTVPDVKVPLGSIVSQSPKADAVQAKGATVTVDVSSGPGDIEVPKLVGLGLAQAKTDLEKLGAKPDVRWVAMAETPTYVVLSQKPAPGVKVKPGSEIQLVVCR